MNGVATNGAKRQRRCDAAGVAACTPQSHRLHYRWSQLEADRGGTNFGAPARPVPKAERTLQLHPGPFEYEQWPDPPDERERFACCADVYKTMEYNTFAKNGVLKLTEVELSFLSAKMTKASCGEWAVLYLGVANGERFRYLRDTFFPKLTVVAYDPIDDFWIGDRSDVMETARRMSADGTNFYFELKSYEPESCNAFVREKIGDKKLLLISDIRGIHLRDDGQFDKAYDNDLQWRAIQSLRPISSLCKFDTPNPMDQFYDYVPGVLLKQIFCNFGTREVRLLIDGVPQHSKRYNTWEIYQKMMYHHFNIRGQVYESTRSPECTRSLCFCFDCSVLWDTLSSYAYQNQMNPHDVLNSVLGNNMSTLPQDEETQSGGGSLRIKTPSWWTRRWEVVQFLLRGRLMDAIATLETDADDDPEAFDWGEIAEELSDSQPALAQRLERLKRPVSRHELVRLLGSLGDPFTLLRTELNLLVFGEIHGSW